MNSIHKVYVRQTNERHWHWKKDCPEYPKLDIESMVSSKEISEQELCSICMELSLQVVKEELPKKSKNYYNF